MKYIVTAGGTGGHIYPGIMLAKELRKRGHEVIFINSNRLIDHQIFDKMELDFPVKHYTMYGFDREMSAQGIYHNLVNVVYTCNVFWKTQRLLLKFKPDHVIGMGGYISFAPVFNARNIDIKTSIHEQNSYPGLVNRKLSKYVDNVFYTYESSKKYFYSQDNLVYTSNPRIDACKNYEGPCSEEYILFLGGSLGAEAINEIAYQYAKENNENVILVSGERYFDEMSARKVIDNLQIIAYTSDVLETMAKASVIVTRAGATTLLEAVAMKKLTIAIPSPNVVADHQTLNAKELASIGAIEYISEEELSLQQLKDTIAMMEKKKESYMFNMKSKLNLNSLEVMISYLEEKDE